MFSLPKQLEEAVRDFDVYLTKEVNEVITNQNLTLNTVLQRIELHKDEMFCTEA